jgi:hypothetical protein
MRIGVAEDYVYEEGCYSFMARNKTYIPAGDLYDIVNRLKEIDEGYFVMRGKRSGRYEVHNRNNIGDTYCFTSFAELDERTIFKTRETAIANSDKLFRKMEEDNRKAQDTIDKDRVDLFGQIAKEELVNPIMKGRIYST